MTLSPTKNKGPLYKRRLMATKMNEGKCKRPNTIKSNINTCFEISIKRKNRPKILKHFNVSVLNTSTIQHWMFHCKLINE